MGTVLTTADMLSSVLGRQQDTGRGKEESAWIQVVSVAPPYVPFPAHLAQVGAEVSRGHP